MTTNPHSAPDLIPIALTRAEALVLFEFLARSDQLKRMPVENHSEQIVLWRLEGHLEKQLPEVLAPSYLAELEKARAEVL